MGKGLLKMVGELSECFLFYASFAFETKPFILKF